MEERFFLNGFHYKLFEGSQAEDSEAYIRFLQELIDTGSEPAGNRLETPTLLVRKPRWPLKEILFVVRGDSCDLAALEWLILLARCSKAAVTMLVVHPDVPGLYNRFPDVQLDIDLLLNLDNETSTYLKNMIQKISKYDIPLFVRIRKAPPKVQIREEVVEGDYDLVIISKECRGRLWRLFFGELVKPLLRWIDRPVLTV
jgi:nucleotide-binding universal stress UspA family protein